MTSQNVLAGKKRDMSYFTRLWENIRQNKLVYLMWVPVFVYYAIFHYAPMAGIVIAFKDYKPFKGMLGSNWVGFRWFVDFLTGPYAWRTIRNTLLINVLQVTLCFWNPILLALLLNEVKNKVFKRTIQTISYMPHFVSLVVMCGLIQTFSRSTGLFSAIGALFGAEPQNYLSIMDAYRPIYIISHSWKVMGWGSIIYLATLSSVDPNLYEAAACEGAGRFRQMWHITLPSLVPVIVIQLIMRLGRMMSEGAEKTILLYNPAIYEVSDIISSFVYRRGLMELNYSYGAAVDLFNVVVNVTILTTANWASRTFIKESLW